MHQGVGEDLGMPIANTSGFKLNALFFFPNVPFPSESSVAVARARPMRLLNSTRKDRLEHMDHVRLLPVYLGRYLPPRYPGSQGSQWGIREPQ